VIEVIHQSDDLLVVNKPPKVALLADRSGAPNFWDEIKAALAPRKAYLVHRLDKGTSGVLLVALNQRTQRTLTRAFQQRRIGKYYLAWVVGRLQAPGTVKIDLPLRPGRKSRFRVAGPRDQIHRRGNTWQLRQPPQADAPGAASETRVRTLRSHDQRTLLLARPITGRTHQLRVHLSWIGHPIVGDNLYGRPDSPEQQNPRLQLHCHRMRVPGFGCFAAPTTKGWAPPA